MSQEKFSKTLLYEENACLNFTNFLIYIHGFAKLSSPFLLAFAVTTLFGLQANAAQGGRVRKGEGGRGLDGPCWSQNNQQRKAGTADFHVDWVGVNVLDYFHPVFFFFCFVFVFNTEEIFQSSLKAHGQYRGKILKRHSTKLGILQRQCNSGN